MDFDSFVLAAATDDLYRSVGREHADAVEFRLDLADEPLEQLSGYDGVLPIIATNRVEWEGGAASDAPNRLDVLRTAVEHPRVEAIDVELSTIAAGDGLAVIEDARERDVSVIVSIHDFEETPSGPEMQRLLSRASEYGDVGKLAVTASTLDDVLRLLAVTRARTQAGQRVATVAMGAVGRHSRAVAPLYGSRIGYAPVDLDHAIAPGQYDLETLGCLIEQLDAE
ncbi:type I 3-dehydroquinate dehydratase [Halocatena pleomorpha]|uniref:3-dehydroquinate dehydratase n=1 Tax=Halocatena pleomorpha TaxID=1785090 RepID=A0A3P3RE07_9EURY|nr:type I 3-dehydroquinate dehydratase [Halocatena pleomorpha]RRJ31188.1 type I 3-dehydroquinate dehydratase [Halocatena pleomorpha]